MEFSKIFPKRTICEKLLYFKKKWKSHKKQLNLTQCKAEAPEARVVRHLEFLKSVQYKPKEPKGLKTGVLLGEKKHMLPILHYLVVDFERIKERAYLARFLVKINVPPEMLQSDESISEAWTGKAS